MEYTAHDNIGLTIEEQLHGYIDHRNTTERHERLWHSWKHNKAWLEQLLEWAMPSFPSYSKHDSTHAAAVLHNIEMLLGEDSIKKLSASDCFLILHVVYIHDIGMCITDEYRRNLMKDKKFRNFLETPHSDPVLQEYVDYLLMECHILEAKCVKLGMESLEIKLKVYYAMTYVLAEYRRKSHGDEAKRLLTKWMNESDKLGSGFSTSGIPSRFFYTIAACASTHTSWDFGDTMSLLEIDGGYAHDFMHPRFAAVMLQLGDALDLDNDRFHPLVKEFNSKVPEQSEIHYEKHKAIRRLTICPSKITIHADCDTPEVLRCVQEEYEMIKNILKDVSLHWSAICPEELGAVLPELEPLVLKFKEKIIEAELVTAKFEIQEEKAFKLLQGNNIYKEGKLVFLREIFQNAIDASKRQYWKDWNGSQWKKSGKKACEKHLSPYAYPIEVDFHPAIKEKFNKELHMMDSEEAYKKYKAYKANPNPSRHEEEYGILVCVTDYGIGITAKDIKAIADVGTSYERHSEEWKRMPHWLQPTAQFGIGLQSVFLVADSYEAETHARNGEKYKIEFTGTGNKGDGYINVIPLSDDNGESSRYGTTFKVFVPCSRISYEYDMLSKSTNNQDPFSIPEDKAKLDQARKGIVHMIRYLDSILGEKLFPVRVRIYDKDEDRKFDYHKLLDNAQVSLQVEIESKDEKKKNRCEYEWQPEEEISEEDIVRKGDVTWTYPYKISGCHSFETEDRKYKYFVDYEYGKLYIADRDYEFYVCVSAERILSMSKTIHGAQVTERESKKETQIYYKGIRLTGMSFDRDMDMLEYIDIKKELKRDYMAMNRSGLTPDGKEYIKDEIYPKVLQYIHDVIEDFVKRKSDDKAGKESTYIERIANNIKNVIERGSLEKTAGGNEAALVHEEDDGNQQEELIHRRILFLIGLAALVRMQNCESYILPGMSYQNKAENKTLDFMLNSLSKYIEEEKIKNHSLQKTWPRSSFYNILVCSFEGGYFDNSGHNLAEIICSENKYVIVSQRNKPGDRWEEYLLNISNERFKKIKDFIIRLKTEIDSERKRALLNDVEEWAEDIVQNAESLVDRNVLKQEPKNQQQEQNNHEILKWLMDNIPSLAIFSSGNDSIRINLLDMEHTDSIYLSKSMRNLIYQRMIEGCEEKEIRRFSTVAMTGYCQLGIENEKSDVYFQKRGRFTQIGWRKIILPLCSETIKFLYKKMNETELDYLLTPFETITNYCDDLYEKYRNGENKAADSDGSGDPDQDREANGSSWSIKDWIEGRERELGESADIRTAIAGRLNELLQVNAIIPENLESIPKEEMNDKIDDICQYLLLGTGEQILPWIREHLLYKWDILINKKHTINWDQFLCKNGERSAEKLFEQYFAYYEVKDDVILPYDCNIERESELQEQLSYRKNRLIQYVRENCWVHNLTDRQIEKLYQELIWDMVESMLVPLKERIDGVRLRYGRK